MEIVGVALAVPGLIDVLIRGGQAIVEKVDTYQTIDETLDRYVSHHDLSLFALDAVNLPN